jgi:hypothetical protein
MKTKKAAEGWCPNCGTRVTGKWEDHGIGSYEYWGAKGTHHDWVCVCLECEEPLEDVEEFDLEPDYYPEDDWREDR